MDLWVWIAIFIVAWLLEALASAAKNKQRQQQPPQQRVPPPQPRRVPPAPRQPPRTVSVPSPRFPPPPVFEVPVVRPPRVRALEPTSAAEGVSAEVEVAEPAPESTDARHTRVTEKYGAPAAGEIGGPEHPRTQARFALRPRTAREAIVWMEILGPPKSERA
jgi:hypothetical protein